MRKTDRAVADFSVRSQESELIDDPSVSDEELARALEELESINRWLGGYAPTVDGVAALLSPGTRAFTLLDVGCGGGDGARRIAQWARGRGLRARIHAIDLSAAAIRHASSRSAGFDEIRYEVADLMAMGGEERFDVVHAALVLHHFPGDEAAEALRRMSSLSRLGVVINDGHRHPIAYGAIAVLTRLFSRSRLIRNDAPLSVLRSFSRAEWRVLAESASLPPPELRWRWAFRWQAVFRKPEGHGRGGARRLAGESPGRGSRA